MVNQIFIAMLLIAAMVSCVPSESIPESEPTLAHFVSEQGGFTFTMPVAGEIIEHTVTRPLFGKNTVCQMTFSRLSGASAMVQYCDLPPQNITLFTANEILDEVSNTVRGEFHMQINNEQEYLVEEIHPALILSGEEDMRGLGLDGKFKARVILVENRVYIVRMSVHYENWCNCLHMIDQVVDSFQVNPNLSIPFEPTP